MATWNTDNPKAANQILEDVADIEENLQELHDVITAITHGTLGTTTAANFRCNAFVDSSDNAVTLPTNNDGVAVFMTGDAGAGNNTMWMYLNAAPTGWKVSATGGDTVLAISGGAGDYNVNGGNPDTAATWDIDGFTNAAGGTGASGASGTGATGADGTGNTGAGTAHNHQWFDANANTASNASFDTNGAEVAIDTIDASGPKAAGGDIVFVLGTGNTEDTFANATLLYTTKESTHTHTGPSHTHTGPSHTHTGPSHTHAISSDSSYRPSASVGKLYDLDTA